MPEGYIMQTALGFRLPRTYESRPRVWIEKLETRRLFSVAGQLDQAVMLDDANHPVATAQVIDGVLTVVTGDGADDVMVGTQADQLFVHVNGIRKYFARGGIIGISIDLGDGDDGFGFHDYHGLVNLPTTVNGGAGDDEIGGENEFNFVGDRIENLGDAPFAPVHLTGGEGNDTLVGAIGDTVVEGGPGTNLMYGRKGLFTILDADAPTKVPTPDPIDDNNDPGAGTLLYFLNDVIYPVTEPSSIPTIITSNSAEPEPAAEPAAGASTEAAAAAVKPTTAGNPSVHDDSLLISAASLFGRRDLKIWG
jgi:hypothetical protein